MKSKTLYWISERQDLDTHEISPAVPQNFLTRGGVIDNKTKRILLYSSLSDAISVFSLGRKNMSGMTLSVYRPRFLPEKNKLTPSLSDSPYSLVLDGEEYWCLIELEMVKVADIRIGEKIGEKKFNYGSRILKHSFTRSETLGVYSWNEILPEWDKKGKTMKLKRQKTFSASIPTSKAAEEAYKKWQESKDPKDAKKFMDIWTREVYIPARKKGIMVDPDPAIVDAASGHIEHPEWVKKKGQKNFGSTAAKATEDKPIAREAGMVGGSALIGLGAGLGVKDIAENGDRILDRIQYRPAKTKVIKKDGKKIIKVTELEDRGQGVTKVINRIRPAGKKVQEFAKTKGGKATLIGVPTAIVGGMVYKAAKKNDKKDKEGGK